MPEKPTLKTINGNPITGTGNLEVGGGEFSGTMDDIDDGATYVKTENNYSDADKTIVDGVTAALAGKSATSHDHNDLYSQLSHDHDATYEPLKGADDNFVTDTEKTKLSNLSGTNSGDNATNTQYSGLAASKQDALVSGTNIKTINSTTILGSGNIAISGGDIVYAPTPADVAINNAADVTIVTKDLTGIAAGDQIIMEGEFIILNNSTATRVYVVTLDFDNAFDIEITTPALATSATLMHPFIFRAVCSVRAINLAYAVVSLDMQLAAGIASGTDTTMAATHLSGKGWGTSASDLTGTLTCNLKIRSANNTATQTCRVVSFTIRKTAAVG